MAEQHRQGPGLSREDFLRAYEERRGQTPPAEATEQPSHAPPAGPSWANAPLWGDEDLVPSWARDAEDHTTSRSGPQSPGQRRTAPSSRPQSPEHRHGYQAHGAESQEDEREPETDRIRFQRLRRILPTGTAKKTFELAKRHKLRTIGSVALLAAVAGGTLRGGAVADAMPDFGSNEPSAAPITEEHYNWPSLDCLDPAFSAHVVGKMQMLTRVTVIDGTDQDAVTKARQQAFSDPKYKVPKELQTTGIFTDSANTVYAWPLPTTDQFTAADNGEKLDPETTTYENRIPLARYGAPGEEVDFGVCLNEGATMSSAIKQLSPYHLVVDDSQFKAPALQNPLTTLDYEVARPQPPTYPEGTEASDKQWIFTEREAQRILKTLAPDGKFNKDKTEFTAGDARNQKALDMLKYSVLKKISTDPTDSNEFQTAMQEALDAKLGAAVDAADGTTVVIDHYNTPTMPGEYFASVVGITPDNIGSQDFAFVNGDVQFDIVGQSSGGANS